MLSTNRNFSGQRLKRNIILIHFFLQTQWGPLDENCDVCTDPMDNLKDSNNIAGKVLSKIKLMLCLNALSILFIK